MEVYEDRFEKYRKTGLNILIGMKVYHRQEKIYGTIKSLHNNQLLVNLHGNYFGFSFPGAFSDLLEVEDEDLQEYLQWLGLQDEFELFKKTYGISVNQEISYLKNSGGKKYRAIDGEVVARTDTSYIYAFDTDTIFNFPEGTVIKFYYREEVLKGTILSCEDFTLMVQTDEFIGAKVEVFEFYAEQWFLLEALRDRLEELDIQRSPLAFEVAVMGKNQMDEMSVIQTGQRNAEMMAEEQPITFIWGPPGTGKTQTLAKIAMNYLASGKRVLMLS